MKKEGKYDNERKTVTELKSLKDSLISKREEIVEEIDKFVEEEDEAGTRFGEALGLQTAITEIEKCIENLEGR